MSLEHPARRGRPASEPQTDLHLRIPQSLLARLDHAAGDVPRLVYIRRLLLQAVDGAPPALPKPAAPSAPVAIAPPAAPAPQPAPMPRPVPTPLPRRPVLAEREILPMPKSVSKR